MGVHAPIHVTVTPAAAPGPHSLPLADVVEEVTRGQSVAVLDVGCGSADALHCDEGVEGTVRVTPAGSGQNERMTCSACDCYERDGGDSGEKAGEGGCNKNKNKRAMDR